MRLDQVDYLPDDVLVKTDRAGMLASLEIRTVYLHRGLAEFAASTDTSLHLGGRGKTPAARDAPARHGHPAQARPVPQGRLPRRRPRSGCAVPSRPPCATRCAAGSLFEEGWFDRAATERLQREHVAGSRDHSDVLWPLLSLGLWGDRIFGRDGA